MLLVENITDIIQNIRQVEAYLTYAEGEKIRNKMLELIRRGNNFVCYNIADSAGGELLHFVPSKYIGYKANSINKHITNRKQHTITGSETDVRINKILGEKIKSNELHEQYHEYCLSLGIPKENLTKRQHKFWILEIPESFRNTNSDISDASEGAIREVMHRIHERNRTIIRLKKAAAKENLRCEVCGFLFFEKYGAIGQDFIEVHHINPVATMQPNKRTRIEDLILICSNCHRMIHSKREGITIDKLKSALK